MEGRQCTVSARGRSDQLHHQEAGRRKGKRARRGGVSLSTVHPEDSLIGDTQLQISGRRDKFDYLVNGTYVDRDNTFDADNNRRLTDPVGAQGGLDESREYNLLAKLGYQINDSQRFQASVNFFSLQQEPDYGARLSTATGKLFVRPFTPEVPIQGNDQDANPGNEAINVNLVYSNEDLLGSSLKIQGYYQDIETIFTKFPGFDQTSIESEKFGVRTTVNTPITAIRNVPFDVTWGLDYLSDKTNQFAIVGDEDPKGDQDAIAGFGQIEIPVGDLGILTGGIRHENVSIDVTGTTPTGEISGSETLFNASASAFLTKELTLFGGFSQAFSPGDVLRQIGDNTFQNIKDLELEFVHTDNYEVGLRAGVRDVGRLTRRFLQYLGITARTLTRT